MSIQDDIRAYARAHGIDPAYALAVASRESSFDPTAHASKTIHGLFQVSGAERNRLGIPLTNDVRTQVAGFSRLTNELHDDMAKRLGREPTPSEMYLGHYWGPGRAAGVINGRYAGMPARDVFTPRELRENPNLKPDKPVDQIAVNIMDDMDRRYQKYGGSGKASDPLAPAPEGQQVSDPWKYLTPNGDNKPSDTAGDTIDNPTTKMAMSGQPVAENEYKPQNNAPDPYSADNLIVDPGTGTVTPKPMPKYAKMEIPQPQTMSQQPVMPLNQQSPPTSTFTPSEDSGLTELALNDGAKDNDYQGGLADLAKNLGSAMSQPKAPAPNTSLSDRELLTQLALAAQTQTPVEGISSIPGQKPQGSANLPGANQTAPSYLDPRMFGLSQQQQ